VDHVDSPLDEHAEEVLARTIEAVQAIRGWRDSAAVRPRSILPARLLADGYADTRGHIERLGRLAWSEPDAVEPVAVIPVLGGAIEILGSDELDSEAAAERVSAQRVKLEAEVKRSEGKLGNDGFVAKAPPAVVQAERDKLAGLRAELEALGE
jgi:valyl-tRNA synthetase